MTTNLCYILNYVCAAVLCVTFAFGIDVYRNDTVPAAVKSLDWELVIAKLIHVAGQADEKRTDIPEEALAETRLLEYLLYDYNPLARPPRSDYDNMISVFVTNLLSVDPNTQVVTVFVRIRFYFEDLRLRWNESEHDDIFNIMLGTNNVWLPPFVHVGAEKVSRLGFDDMKITVFSGGLVAWMVDDVYSFPCNLKVSKFPFDRHTCNLTLYLTTSVPTLNFICVDLSESLKQFAVANPEWKVTNSECYFPENSLSLIVQIDIERKPWFHVVNLFAPIACLAMMNSFTFLLPVEAGDRIGLCVTIFLAFTVFVSFIATTVPTSSDDVPYISYVLIIQAIIGILTLLGNVLMVNFHHTAPQMFDKLRLRCVCNRNADSSHDETTNVTGKLLDSHGQNLEHKGDAGVDESDVRNVSTTGSSRMVDIICFITTLVLSLAPLIVYLVLVLS